MKIIRKFLLSCLLLFLGFVQASDNLSDHVKVVEVKKWVVKSNLYGLYPKLEEHDRLYRNATVTTHKKAFARLGYPSGSQISLFERSCIRIVRVEPTIKSLRALWGKMEFAVEGRDSRRFEILTPLAFIVAGKGELAVEANEKTKRTVIRVFAGKAKVLCQNRVLGQMILDAGRKLVIETNTKELKTVPIDDKIMRKRLEESVQRMNIAVLNLDVRDGLTQSEVWSISDRLRGYLIATRRFEVIERSQMDVILKEQGFQQTGACSEASCIVEAGQLLAVHKMVGGSISKVDNLYSINLKIIDVESGSIENQAGRDVKCSMQELLGFHLRNLAREMAGLKALKKPLITRWYFWAPIGLAAAGTAGFLALPEKPVEKPPEKGWIEVTW